MNVPMVCFAPFKLHTNVIQGRLVQWVNWLARKTRAIFPPWPDPNSCTEAFMSVISVIYLGVVNHGGMSSEMACWSVFNPNVPTDMCSIPNDIWTLYWHWGAWPSTQNSPSTSWSTFSSHPLQGLPHPLLLGPINSLQAAIPPQGLLTVLYRRGRHLQVPTHAVKDSERRHWAPWYQKEQNQVTSPVSRAGPVLGCGAWCPLKLISCHKTFKAVCSQEAINNAILTMGALRWKWKLSTCIFLILLIPRTPNHYWHKGCWKGEVMLRCSG